MSKIDRDTLKHLLRLLINKVEVGKDGVTVECNDNINNFLYNIKKGQLI